MLSAAIVRLMCTWKHISTCTFPKKKCSVQLELVHTWADDILTFEVPYILIN